MTYELAFTKTRPSMTHVRPVGERVALCGTHTVGKCKRTHQFNEAVGR